MVLTNETDLIYLKRIVIINKLKPYVVRYNYLLFNLLKGVTTYNIYKPLSSLAQVQRIVASIKGLKSIYFILQVLSRSPFSGAPRGEARRSNTPLEGAL